MTFDTDGLEQRIRERAKLRGLNVDLERLRYSNALLYAGEDLAKTGTALYVGVGHGHDALAALLGGRVGQIVGVDPYISSHGNGDRDYRELEEFIATAGLGERFRVVRTTVQKFLEQTDERFDIVVCNDVLHHIFVTKERLSESAELGLARDLFSRFKDATSASGRLLVSEVQRNGIRPWLHNLGVLPGCVNYRTKQSWKQWRKAIEAGGWQMDCLDNYLPYAFRDQAAIWSGLVGRYTLCDRYFMHFGKRG